MVTYNNQKPCPRCGGYSGTAYKCKKCNTVGCHSKCFMSNRCPDCRKVDTSTNLRL